MDFVLASRSSKRGKSSILGHVFAGDRVLEAVCCRSGENVRRPVRHLFLFIGAEPNTGWLASSGIALDSKGFVLTGNDLSTDGEALETSQRGVFAIGDVRSGSIKRVASAVGEGAQVVATLHRFLSKGPNNFPEAHTQIEI
jgi:thioredoxin reductase (NADPH)